MDDDNIGTIGTTVLRIVVQINGKVPAATPDSGTATSVISRKLADKLELKYTMGGEPGLRAIANQLKVIGSIQMARIMIGEADVSSKLTVIESDYDTLLLGMDWFHHYKVELNVKEKVLRLEINGQRY